MAANIDPRIYNPIRDDLDSDKPSKLHHCEEVIGQLSEIRDDAESGYIVATIHESQIVLPPEMRARLEPLIRHEIELTNFFNQYYILDLAREAN